MRALLWIGLIYCAALTAEVTVQNTTKYDWEAAVILGSCLIYILITYLVVFFALRQKTPKVVTLGLFGTAASGVMFNVSHVLRQYYPWISQIMIVPIFICSIPMIFMYSIETKFHLQRDITNLKLRRIPMILLFCAATPALVYFSKEFWVNLSIHAWTLIFLAETAFNDKAAKFRRYLKEEGPDSLNFVEVTTPAQTIWLIDFVVFIIPSSCFVKTSVPVAPVTEPERSSSISTSETSVSSIVVA